VYIYGNRFSAFSFAFTIPQQSILTGLLDQPSKTVTNLRILADSNRWDLLNETLMFQQQQQQLQTTAERNENASVSGFQTDATVAVGEQDAITQPPENSGIITGGSNGGDGGGGGGGGGSSSSGINLLPPDAREHPIIEKKNEGFSGT
jgi:hypothetical protein